MASQDKFIASFLEDLEQYNLLLDKNIFDLAPHSQEKILELFRIFHTIKTSAKMIGLKHFSIFSHQLETLLKLLLDEKITISPSLKTLFYHSSDLIKQISQKIKSGQFLENEFISDKNWMEQIALYQKEILSYIPATSSTDYLDSLALTLTNQSDISKASGQLLLQFDTLILTKGIDPDYYIQEIFACGMFNQIKCKKNKLPPLERFNPLNYYLEWILKPNNSFSFDKLRRIFEFLDQSLYHLTLEEDKKELNLPGNEKINAIASQDHVRVPKKKLDELLNYFGEAVMGYALLKEQLSPKEKNDLLYFYSENFTRTLRNIQDKIMEIRLVQLSSLFNQYYRIVEEESAELGKEIQLQVQGDELEVDKQIIDLMGEPLRHLLQNSIDHGIETPAERIKKNKPRVGTILLKALLSDTGIQIIVQDDGHGIDKEKIILKALDKGLIDFSQKNTLGEEQIFNLIFHPDFSTKEEITTISGRGIGMNIVQKNIEKIRGHISISSEQDKGTQIKLHLPSTMSIMDVILLRYGKEVFAVQQNMIKEFIQLKPEQIISQESRHSMIEWNGKSIPNYGLNLFFPEITPDANVKNNPFILIFEWENQTIGIAVDELMGEQQIVFKSIGYFEQYQNGIMGTTILGNGKIAFILDILYILRELKNKFPDNK